MINHTRFITLLTLVSLLLPLTLPVAKATERTDGLTGKVAALELGMNGYIIGIQLPAEKKKYSSDHLQSDAYEGTYKFSDGELFVVVAQKDDTVLAIYQRNEEADIDQAKKMISGLMGLFGDPTAMAHDKLIYWAYNEGKKIPEEEYEKSREETAPLEVLGTVKFSSSFAITDDNPDDQQKGTVYFIISSDRLTEEFMKKK